jgi:putative flippase GtrA
MKSSGFFNQDTAPYQLRNWIHNEKIVGFFLIGIISSIIDIGLLYVLCAYGGVWYITAAAVSYCCGIVASYILNKYLTFHDTDRHYVTQFTTFTAISISCLLVNLCIVWLAVELFSLNYLTGKIIATLVSFVWNYHGQKRFTFSGGR